MLRLKFLGAGLVAAVVTFSASYGHADDEFSARLNGFNELGGLNNETGAVLSDGTGTVSLKLHKNSIDYTLTYANVGTTPPKTGTVLFAHIHFGKSHNAGGVLVFFCTNAPFAMVDRMRGISAVAPAASAISSARFSMARPA